MRQEASLSFGVLTLPPIVCGPRGLDRLFMATKPAKAAEKKPVDSRIADNKKAIFNYHIEERFEAGMVLEGWEVKALRMGKVQLTDGYVVIRGGELF